MSERIEKVRKEIATIVKMGDRLVYAVLFRTGPEMINQISEDDRAT